MIIKQNYTAAEMEEFFKKRGFNTTTMVVEEVVRQGHAKGYKERTVPAIQINGDLFEAEPLFNRVMSLKFKAFALGEPWDDREIILRECHKN